MSDADPTEIQTDAAATPLLDVGTPRSELLPGPMPLSPGAPSFLILFSTTGFGHRAAADALRTAIQRRDPRARVVIADPLIGEGTWLARRLCSSYSLLTNGSTAVWGALYRMTDSRRGVGIVRSIVRTQTTGVMERLLLTHDPDVVTSVHPLLNHVWTATPTPAGKRRALVTVVTDLIDVHRAWLSPRADLVVVGTAEAALTASKYSDPKRVRQHGLPIHPSFRPPEPAEQARLRSHFGLARSRPTVLIMGGGYGSGRILQQVRALTDQRYPWQVVVVCGRNERLRRELLGQPLGTFGVPTLVLGFTHEIADLMRASDLVVTKAGSLTVAEALATAVPLVLTGYIKGQEKGNVRLVESTGAGVYVPDIRNLRSVVEELLDNSRKLHQMRRRCADLAHPTAAVDIAEDFLRLAMELRAAE